MLFTKITVMFTAHKSSTSIGNLCKMTVGISSLDWIEYTNYDIPYDVIPITQNIAYIVLRENTSAHFLFQKVDFSLNPVAIWSTKVDNAAGGTGTMSRSLLSTDETMIYNGLMFENKLLLIIINEADGLAVATNKFPSFKYR